MATVLLFAGCGAPTSAPTTVTVTAGQSPTAPTGSPAPRGLLSTEAEWNSLYGSATVAECVAQGLAGDIGADRAWRLPNDGLACVKDPSYGVWGDRVINATLYFDLHVDSRTAIAAAAVCSPLILCRWALSNSKILVGRSFRTAPVNSFPSRQTRLPRPFARPYRTGTRLVTERVSSFLLGTF